MTQKNYLPRLAGYVYELGGPKSQEALEILSVLPAHDAMVEIGSMDSHCGICANIILTLASDSLVAPGAMAWAFRYASLPDNAVYMVAF